MLLGGRVIGVIGLNNFDREGAYDQHHKKLLETIAGQAAVAIANARQYDLINNELKRRITGLEAVSRLQRKASSIKPAQ
jgi:GAF domain-containing protein